MKELSIEEKAKRYDEALKVLHKYDGANIMFSQSLKEEMFPELRESEDERIRKHLISFFNNLVTFGNASICETEDTKVDNILAWLEKQGEHKPTAWSEEDELTINDIICYIRQRLNYESEKGKKKIQKCEDWLKSLKGRVQPKQEWSEEDEEKINSICNIIADKRNIQKQGYRSYYNGLIDWLNSLRSQKKWKPSKEQLKIFEYYLDADISNKDKEMLIELYNQLKQL